MSIGTVSIGCSYIKCSDGKCNHVFKDSGGIIESCPKCKGYSLDRENYNQLIEYLTEYLAEKNSAGYLDTLTGQMHSLYEDIRKLKYDISHIASIYHLLSTRFAIEHPRLKSFIEQLYHDTPLK